MDNYEKLLKEINMFLEEREVEKSREVISLYELYNIMDQEFINLRKLSTIENVFTQKLRMFRNCLFGKRDDFFIKDIASVNIYGDEKISKITFSNSDTKDCDDFYEISVIKDKNKEDIYLDKKMGWNNKYICKFIKKNFDLILDILLDIEEYYELIGKTSNKEKDFCNFEGFNNLFYYKISYNKNGWISIYNNVSQKHPLYEEVDKTYLQKKSIHEYINEKNKDILKRIPININELPIDILNIYNKGKEYQKEKHLEKSIHWWN